MMLDDTLNLDGQGDPPNIIRKNISIISTLLMVSCTVVCFAVAAFKCILRSADLKSFFLIHMHLVGQCLWRRAIWWITW